MAAGRYERSTERRKGRDPIKRIMIWSGIAGWLVLLIVMVMLDRAKPDDPSFTPNRNIFEQAGVTYHLRTSWDQDLVTYIFYLLIVGFLLGVVGLVANYRRHRRRDDIYRIHLMVLTAISAAGIVYYLI